MTHHLLILLGLHSKVFTESIYALCVKQNIPVSQVTVICTASAKEKTVETLLATEEGKYYQLCHEYPDQFQQVQFTEASILVASNDRSPIWDISDSGQSQAYLDLILSTVNDITSRENTCLHAVAGGGRRTLSVYLAMVMQLLARDQDVFYHLVVSPWDIEINSDFYYPTRRSRPMVTYSGARFDAKDVFVELVDIPFIRLRNRFPATKLNAKTGQQLLAWAQHEINGAFVLPELALDLQTLSLRIGEDTIRLQPQQFCLYWYFAGLSRNRPQEVPFDAYERYFEPSGSPFFSDEMLSTLLAHFDIIDAGGEMRRHFVAMVVEDRQLPMTWVLQKISRINERIRERLSQAHLIPFYSICAVGKRGRKYYGIKVEGEKIKTPAVD